MSNYNIDEAIKEHDSFVRIGDRISLAVVVLTILVCISYEVMNITHHRPHRILNTFRCIPVCHPYKVLSCNDTVATCEMKKQIK